MTKWRGDNDHNRAAAVQISPVLDSREGTVARVPAVGTGGTGELTGWTLTSRLDNEGRKRAAESFGTIANWTLLKEERHGD